MGDLRGRFDMEIGKRLRSFRKAKRLTQEKLAEALGTNAQYISQLERGERGLGHDMLSRYCEFFNLTAERIGMIEDDRGEHTPAVRVLLDQIKGWSEADVLRLAAHASEQKAPPKTIELPLQKVTDAKDS